jgi:two-component system, OmpR family, sensor kinase
VSSLRSRLLAAIAFAVALSVGLTLAVGLELTQREVERAALADLGRRADVLAERERAALLPLSRLKPVQQTLAGQDEELVAAPLVGPTQYLDAAEQAELRHGRAVEGVRDGRYYAARVVAGRALVLLRPQELDAATSRPFARGLLVAGLAGLLLAVGAAVLLARAIVRPVGRVASAARSLSAEHSPDPVPAEGPTELALLAEAFNDMSAKLTRARAAERDFLLSVSHELKTPLTAIRGYAEGAAEGTLDARESAGTIAREAQRLERLVRDLLDLARINRSEFAVHREPIDLAAVAREAVSRYEWQARAFGIELAAETNGGGPALGDADRVLQVVSNLVENALRVTPAGGRVTVAVEPAEVRVEDTGPGLRADELPRAFERFFLYSRYGAERKVGTGLGLAIVRQLAERMGGRVSVESEPGRTRFVVVLPSADTGARGA